MEKSIVDIIKKEFIEEMENYFLSSSGSVDKKRYIHGVCILEDLLGYAGVTYEEIEELERQARENVRGK